MNNKVAFNKVNDFNIPKKIEMNERNILCDCIENYINIANKNNTTLDDYFSIIAFINILKKQYPNYIDDFNKYIYIFDNTGIIELYNKNNTNIAKKYFCLYEGNDDKAYEIINGFIPNCSNRFINFMIAIGICGPPTTVRKKHILSQAYSWNSYSFAWQSIYYTNLCLEEEKNNLYLLELNADNYLKVRDYGTAINYYKYVLKKSKSNLYLYKKIAIAYRRNNQKEEAISFLKKEMLKRAFDFEAQKVIFNELKKIKQNKFY